MKINKKRVINKTTDAYSKVSNKTNKKEEETIMEKKNNENNTLKKGKRVRTLAGITIASLLTGIVFGGTILLNEGKAEITVNPKNVEVSENVAEGFKYKGEGEGSILNIQEELAKIDREETKKRQEEFKKQLAEQKQEEERLAEEEARVKAEEEARVKAEEEARVKAEEEARVKAEEARIVAEQQAQQQASSGKTTRGNGSTGSGSSGSVSKGSGNAKSGNTGGGQASAPNVNTQQPVSDPVEGTDDSALNFDRDKVYYQGYTQNGEEVEGFQW